MPIPDGEPGPLPTDSAADWVARMHGPEADASRAAFEAWRAADPAHRIEYARLERLWRMSAQVEDSPAAAAARREALKAMRPWYMRPALRLAMAASIVALLLLSATVFGSANSRLVPAAEAMTVAETRIGEIRELTLHDGSTITLDTDSRVEIRFSSSMRQVTLVRGRARFTTTPDATRPFRVEAAGTTIVGTGARFDALLGATGLCAAALDGRLELVRNGRSLALASGQSAGTQGGGLQPRATPEGAERWPEGMLTFNATPLGEVLDATNRYSARHILLADPALAGLRVTGAFRPLPVEELAQSLATAFELKLSPSAQGNLVLGKR